MSDTSTIKLVKILYSAWESFNVSTMENLLFVFRVVQILDLVLLL